MDAAGPVIVAVAAAPAAAPVATAIAPFNSASGSDPVCQLATHASASFGASTRHACIFGASDARVLSHPSRRRRDYQQLRQRRYPACSWPHWLSSGCITARGASAVGTVSCVRLCCGDWEPALARTHSLGNTIASWGASALRRMRVRPLLERLCCVPRGRRQHCKRVQHRQPACSWPYRHCGGAIATGVAIAAGGATAADAATASAAAGFCLSGMQLPVRLCRDECLS